MNARYTTPPPDGLLPAWRAVFERQKAFCEHAFAQLGDARFFQPPAPGLNAVAVIAQHIAANLLSRFTDFLTTDGEKPWRDRDREFIPPPPSPESRAALMQRWEEGWAALFSTLESLRPEDLSRTVTIRSVPHPVHAAIARALDHTAYHTGQITTTARLLAGTDGWPWFTIPPGGTDAFNRSLGHTP